MCLIFHVYKSDIFIELSGSNSSIISCSAPIKVRKVHDLNTKPMIVKVVTAIPTDSHLLFDADFANDIEKKTMPIKLRIEIAFKTIPIIKITLHSGQMEPKNSTESIIKSMVKHGIAKNQRITQENPSLSMLRQSIIVHSRY